MSLALRRDDYVATATRLPLRFCGREPPRFQIVSAALQVPAKLLFHLTLDAGPTEQKSHSGANC